MEWKSRRIEAILEQALVEDKATSDITTSLTVDPGLRAAATILAKEECVLSGLGCIPRFLDIFARLDGHSSGRYEVVSHPEIFDGVRMRKGQAAAVIRHNARVILACERVILNLMQRMSGIATLTRRYVDEIRDTGAKILDTRKTVPGLRILDKYAVRCGGGENHRLDLSDGILIKNNHISLGGGIEKVLARAKERRKPGQTIDIEVRNLAELTLALDHGAESLLLDNMTPAEVKNPSTSSASADSKFPSKPPAALPSRTFANTRSPARTTFPSARSPTPPPPSTFPCASPRRFTRAVPAPMPTLSHADPFDLAALDAALAGTRFAGKLHFFPSIPSTNTPRDAAGRRAALPMAASTLPMSKPPAADVAPTPGHSPPGSGLYVTILCVRASRQPTFFGSRSPPASPRRTPSATSPRLQPISAGRTTCCSDRRKFCGILTELNAEVTRVRHAVIGIGINVHQPHFPDDLRAFATSLSHRNRPRLASPGPAARPATIARCELAALAAAADLAGRSRKASASRLEAAPPGFAASACASMKAMDSPEPPKAWTRAAFCWSARPQGLRTVLSGGVREARP